MELSSKVFIQVVIIFILMMIGFVLAKTKKVTEVGTNQMTDILLMIVTPCVLVNAYQKDFSPELLKGLLVAAALTLIIHIIAIIICAVVFRKEKTLRYRVSIFAAIYSNCGFMAIPLLTSALGNDGVFYGSAYLAVFTLLYWTHGICVYSGSLKELSLKKVATNPGIIGTLIALLLFLLKITLPGVIKDSVGFMASMNTPLAMIVMGAYLARVDFAKALKNLTLYAVSFIRLILIPVIAVVITKLFKVDPIIAKSIIISSACPTAAVSALLATKYKLDSSYAAEIVSVSTIISIVTIPLILMLY